MKKTDIAMIILIATISVLAAFFVTRAIMGTPSEEVRKAQTIDKIDETLTEPSDEIFNSDAINPAVKIEIGGDS